LVIAIPITSITLGSIHRALFNFTLNDQRAMLAMLLKAAMTLSKLISDSKNMMSGLPYFQILPTGGGMAD
jgi:hypothetical protein